MKPTRATTPPPYDSPEAWAAAGKPPMALTNNQVAILCNFSKVYVCNLAKQGKLHRSGGVIDFAHPVNFAWLENRVGQPQQTKSHQKPNNPTTHKGNEFLRPPPPPEQPADNLGASLDAILEMISKGDLSQLTPAAIKKVRDLESALKVRVDREAKRGQLIDRALVSSVFAKLYQIDTNSYGTLGAKLAPDVAGMFGIEDAESILRVEQKIEAEVFKIRAHIQRMLRDFLTDVGVAADQLDEALRGCAQ